MIKTERDGTHNAWAFTRANQASLFLLLAIFVPGHMFDWALERLFALLLLFGGGLALLMGVRLDRAGSATLLFLFGLSVLTFVSVAHHRGAVGDEYLLSIVEIVRYPLLVAGFVLLKYFAKGDIRNSVQFAGKALVLFALIGAASIGLDIPILAPVFDYLYGDTKTVIAGGWIRLSIPFENPNFLGLVLSCMFFLFLMSCLASRGAWLWLPPMVFTIYLTGSRTAWALAFIFLLGFAVRYSWRLGVKQSFAGIVVIGSILGFGVLYGDVLAGQARVQMLSKIIGGGLSADDNFMGRVDMMRHAWARVVDSDSVFFGIGPSKSYGSIDSQYFLLVQRLGLFGLSIYLMFMLFAFFSLSDRRGGYATALNALVLLLALATGAYFDNFRVWFICMMIFIAISQESFAYDVRKKR